MDKKGQIGKTITWVVAFVVIFFIMAIFVGSVGILAGKKKVPVVGEGGSIIDVEGGSLDDVRVERDLLVALQRKVEGRLEVHEMLKKAHEDFFERTLFMQQDIRRKSEYSDVKRAFQSLTEHFDGSYDECYLLCVDFDPNTEKKGEYLMIGDECVGGEGDVFDRASAGYSCGVIEGEFRSGEARIFSGSRGIDVKLYVGDIEKYAQEGRKFK